MTSSCRGHRRPSPGTHIYGPKVDEARRHKDGGATLVEFAVVAPLLFLLLFGVVEFARVVHGFTTVWSAAREGARYATTVGDSNGNGTPNYADCNAIIDAALGKVVAVSLTDSDVTVTYFDRAGTEVANCDSGGADPLDVVENGYRVEVGASATFNAVVPLLSSFLDGIDLDSAQSRSIFKGIVGRA